MEANHFQPRRSVNTVEGVGMWLRVFGLARAGLDRRDMAFTGS